MFEKHNIASATLRMIYKMVAESERFYREYSLMNGIDKAAKEIVKDMKL